MRERIKFQKKQIKWFVLAAVLLATAVYWRISSEERAVKAVINKSIAFVEENDASGAVSYVSDRYKDKYGYSRQDLADIARETFETIKEINVSVEDTQITFSDNQAEVVLIFKVVGSYQQQRGYVLGDFNHPIKARIHFQLESEGWRIIRIDNFHEWNH